MALFQTEWWKDEYMSPSMMWHLFDLGSLLTCQSIVNLELSLPVQIGCRKINAVSLCWLLNDSMSCLGN